MKKFFEPNTKNLILFIGGLSVCWLIYCFIFNAFAYTFGIVFSFCYLVFFLFLDPEKKYYVILFTLPFASIFKIGSGLPSSMIFLYLFFIIQLVVQKNLRIKKEDCFVLLFLIFSQLASTMLYEGSYMNMMSFILNVIFMKVCVLSFMPLPNKSRVLANSTFIFGTAMSVSIVSADLFPEIPYIVMWEKQTILMSINRFSGLNADPNYYSQLVLVAICLLIATLLVKQKKTRWIGLLLCLFLIMSGFRSISKSYALSMIVIVAASFVYFIHSIKGNTFKESIKKILLSAVIFSVGIVSLLVVVEKFVIPVFEMRSETRDILTGRGDIWQDYLQLILIKPEILSIGVGFSNDANILGKELDVYMAPHNIYLELVVGCGLIGVLLLFLLFRELFSDLKDTIKSPYFLFLILFLFTSFGLSLSSNDAFFILVPLIILFQNGVSDHEKNSNHHTNAR